MIQIDVHHYFHVEPAAAVINRLDAILGLMQESKAREVVMSQEMDALVVAVNENTSLDDSVIALLNGLSAQILDAAGDKAKATALAAEVKAKSEAVATAIAANTPAAPAPPEEPPA